MSETLPRLDPYRIDDQYPWTKRLRDRVFEGVCGPYRGRSAKEMAIELGCDVGRVRDRLVELLAAGLVRRVNERGRQRGHKQWRWYPGGGEMTQHELLVGTGVGSGADLEPPHRYWLWRRWDDRFPVVTWVMLNPSTADATEDDATIRICTGFAKRWGFGGIEVVNLFAYQATHPRDLKSIPYETAVGQRNDAVIERVVAGSTKIVAAWGASVPSLVSRRAPEVLRLMHGKPIHALAETMAGRPVHPLRQPLKRQAKRWWP